MIKEISKGGGMKMNNSSTSEYMLYLNTTTSSESFLSEPTIELDSLANITKNAYLIIGNDTYVLEENDIRSDI